MLRIVGDWMDFSRKKTVYILCWGCSFPFLHVRGNPEINWNSNGVLVFSSWVLHSGFSKNIVLGHCNHFASSAVIWLRARFLSTALVNWLVSTINRLTYHRPGHWPHCDYWWKIWWSLASFHDGNAVDFLAAFVGEIWKEKKKGSPGETLIKQLPWNCKRIWLPD